MRFRTLIPVLAAAACLPSPSLARSAAGQAEIVDGDTLKVGNTRIRLFGIDAPEARQSCFKNEEPWNCGIAAAEALQTLIGQSDVTCEGQELDTYGRLLATCMIGPTDIAREMIAAGWATAFRKYSDRYIAEETRARAARVGIWGSTFDMPEDFRNAKSTPAGLGIAGSPATRPPPSPARTVQQPPRQTAGRCLIKGNRNRKGQWIYHMPGMPYYDRTRPEEIFCSEAQARAAGYRRAIVR